MITRNNYECLLSEKQTSRMYVLDRANVCLWPKADLETESKSRLFSVCYWKKADVQANFGENPVPSR